MLTDMDLSLGLSSVSGAEIIYRETIIPSACARNPNSVYRPEYDWLFTHERILASVLEPWMPHLRFELIGQKGILCEALSNAFCHGHRKDPSLPIELCVYLGEKGLIVRIKDSGKGFDLDLIRDKYEKGRAYYHVAGNGLRLMIDSENFHVFFTDQGTAFNLLYYFKKS